MKKTPGAEPGWYDDPEDENRERFWNGKYWEKNTRFVGEESENPLAIDEFQRGPLLFRKPFGRDNALKVYLALVGLSSVSAIFGEFQAGTRNSLIPVMTVALIPIMALYIYVLFLPYLIYRRKKDNARVSHSGKLIVESKKKKNYIVLSIAGVVLFAGLSFLGGGSNGSSSKIEGFIESEKKISEVLGRYNSEAGVAVGVVRGISDGTLSAGDGIGKFAVAGSKVTPILSELRNVCAGISFPEITGQGEELALAKAMNMLKVACDVTPQQFLVLQQIFQEQISDSGTQQRLDELSTQLQNLGQTKIDAAVEGIKAMLPYANEDEAKLLNAMLEGFANR